MRTTNSEQQRLHLESIHGIPFTCDNQVRILRNGNEIFPAMLTAIKQAEKIINFLTYVYWAGNIADEFAESLARKAREGVIVRVLLDAYGAKQMPDSLISSMKDAGVRIAWFRPLKGFRIWQMDNRTHRKALICDNTIAFTGGVGIAEEWDGDARNPNEWRETHFELRGSAVQGINGAFWDNWIEASQEEYPELETEAPLDATPKGNTCIQTIQSSAARHYSDAAVVMRTMIELAKDRLAICTPYLVLDATFLPLICDKARSGVKVEILIPGERIDKRFENWTAEKDFTELLDAGVEIYRYKPTMIHTKVILVDEDLACVGSPNLNQRSMRKDDELILLIQDRDVSERLRQHFEEDRSQSAPMRDTDWLGNPIINAIKRYALRPFQEQL